MATRLRSSAAFLRSRLFISVLKASISYTVAFVLVFNTGFTSTLAYPVVLPALVLITIAGGSGKSVGAYLDGLLTGAAGVAVGALAFYILAICGSPIAQGFIFFACLYGAAYIKSLSMRYFGFSLLAILVAFAGIYTSTLLGSFSPEYLESYLTAYAYGFAIVTVVNFCIFPITAERELREIIVLSLDHISVLAHLMSKTYTLDISDEEVELRDGLLLSIRADFGLLTTRLSETSIELNYTRYSMADYTKMVSMIRSMQQGLNTCYSIIASARADVNPECMHLVQRQLQLGTRSTFATLRRTADLIQRDIVAELSTSKVMETHTSSADWTDFIEPHHVDFIDVEGGSRPSRPRALSTASDLRLRLHLSQEVDPHNQRHQHQDGSHLDVENTEGKSGSKTPGGMTGSEKVAFFRRTWESFEEEQRDAIGSMIGDSMGDDEDLWLDRPGATMRELFPRPPSTSAAAPISQTTSSSVNAEHPHLNLPPAGTSHETNIATVVLRCSSYLVGMSTVISQLASLHDLIVPTDRLLRRPKSFHLHFFESIPRSTGKATMSVQDAVAALDGRVYVQPHVPLWRRVALFEQWLRSDSSSYAFQTAVAVSIFAIFLLAPSLSAFFVQYGLTGGILTLVVSMSPTLGQSIFVFIFQILGTGIGALYGLLILEICRIRIEGHTGVEFNPYALCVLLAVYAFPMSYLIHAVPQYFTLALLALNGTGTIVITEWVYTSVPGQIRPGFDTPALRCAKALVSMMIALVISFLFQTLLRTPARKKLRLKLAGITSQLASYNILFQYLMSAAAPISAEGEFDITSKNQLAIVAMRNELVARELQLQADILSLYPLMKFAAVEPAFGQPFQAATMMRLINKHQAILDRLREARTAVGITGFGSDVHQHFTHVLAPYRFQSRRYSHALFYLCATSLATKRPLPSEIPSMSIVLHGITHDALVISARLWNRSDSPASKITTGRDIIKSPNFLRYWFYLSSYSTVGDTLEKLEVDLRAMFSSNDGY